MQRTCPYYIVNDEAELLRVRKALGGYDLERLHPFPFIVGREPGFTFQCKGSAHPIPPEPGTDGEPDLVYDRREIPA
jgi:hypothetical protein